MFLFCISLLIAVSTGVRLINVLENPRGEGGHLAPLVVASPFLL
jgi:hypothetical protein